VLQVLLVHQLLEVSLRRVVAALAMDSLMVDRIDGVGDVKTMNYASHILDVLCLIRNSCLKLLSKTLF
jgi:hypothetical protein